jgi:serine/threonine protein kinase/WD40 repeat protein
MGIVYRAVQLEPRREVALKMLLPHQVSSPEMLERFRLEARAIAALEHPAILPVHHVGEHNGLPFFTMKLATGGTLAQRQERFAGDWRVIAELVATLADAVQFAHERGVLHRDLKPGNVLFDEAGRAYVSDFGLAKLVGTDSDLTRSVQVLGTPHYVAPEIAARSAKEATTASDVYSLGAILYELLSGSPPYEAEGVPALLKKIAEETPVAPSNRTAGGPRPQRVSQEQTKNKDGANSTHVAASGGRRAQSGSVPRDLEVICLKCLAKEPARRYACAHDLAEDLRRWLAGRNILARPATRVDRLHAWRRRNPTLAAMIAVLALVLITAVIREARSNRRLQRALSESLLKQARLERSSGRMGQRFETLSLVSRAVDHLQNSWSGMSPSNLVSLRNEAAAALALPDVRPLVRWPIHISHFENSVDFTASLDRYVTAAPGGGFTVFSTADHKPLYHVGGETNNLAVKLRLHPAGRWAAVRFQDGYAELHELPTNFFAASRESAGSLRDGVDAANGGPSAALSRDAATAALRRWPGERNAGAIFAFAQSGDRFAVVPFVAGKPRVVEIIDLQSGATLGQLPGGEVTHMALNHAATHLAMAGAELTVWRLRDTNQLWATPLTHYAAAIEWSPDEQHIALSINRELATGAATRENDPVLLFHAATGRQKSVLAEFVSTPARLEFSPDSQSLVAATWSDQVLWASTRPKEFQLTVPGAHRALRFSPDGRKLGYAPSREELGLLELVTPAVWHEWQMTSPPALLCFAIDISTDGRWVATSAVDGIHLWDAEQRAEVASRAVPGKPWWMTLFFGQGDAFLYYSAANFGVRRVELIRTNTPDGRTRIQFGSEQQLGFPRDNMALGLASDGPSLIVLEDRRKSANERVPPTVWLWSEGNPGVARKLAEAFPLVGYRAVAGGPWAVTTDRVTPDVWIWNFETGKRVRSLGIPLQVNSEPTSNGRWLATRTRQEFAVWEVGTWRAISRWPAPRDEQDNGSIISSKDSRLLATDTADAALVLRELPLGAELVKLIPPRSLAVREWTFSPDSKRLIILLKNGQVVEWNLAELRRELAKVGLDWEISR